MTNCLKSVDSFTSTMLGVPSEKLLTPTAEIVRVSPVARAMSVVATCVGVGGAAGGAGSSFSGRGWRGSALADAAKARHREACAAKRRH
jgi:hypothetical protein